MKQVVTILSIAFLSLVFFACQPHGHKRTEKEYRLNPRASQTVYFQSNHPVRINFTTIMSSPERAKCMNQCIRMLYRDKSGAGEAVTSPISAYLDIKPDDGKINVTIENLELFPITVRVVWAEI